MKCRFCSVELDPDRVEFLTLTKRNMLCTKCTKEEQQLCLMSFEHKTAPTLVVVPNDKESKRKALRAFHRSR